MRGMLYNALMILRAAVLFAVLFAAGGALAEGAKTGALSLTVFYDFSYNGIKVAEVADTLAINDNGEYQINRVAAAVGFAKVLHGDVVNTSEGKTASYGLQMSHYKQKRGNRPLQTADYDGDILKLARGDEQKSTTLAAPLYDYLTIIYNHYVLGRILTGAIRQTDGWRIREYHYETGEEETMQTPYGELKVIPVTYQSKRGPRIFWLAPALGYLPVRSIVDDKGHIFETTMTGGPPPPN